MITSIKRFSLPRGFKLVGYDETGAATVLRKTCTTPYVLAALHQGFDYGPETYRDAKGRSMYVTHKNDAKNSWTFHRSATANLTRYSSDVIVRTLPIEDGDAAAPAAAAPAEVASGLFRQPKHNAENPIVVIGETIAAPEGNFGPDFDYSPRPISKHPFVCSCPHCTRRQQERELARQETRNRYGV